MMPSILENVPLDHRNTLGVSAQALFFTSLSSPDQLVSLLDFADDNKIPFLILGGGSNVVITHDYPGLVISNELKGIDVVEVDGQSVLVTAAAGENWHDLVCYCLSEGYCGLENLSLIPGSVGAAPIQNIGAYGVELCDVIERVKGWDCEQKQFRSLDSKQCQFSYRHSIFKSTLKARFIITSVTLRLSKTGISNCSYEPLTQHLEQQGITQATAQQVADAVIAIRKSKLPDPTELANAGSFFKNPIITSNKASLLLSQFPDLISYPLSNNKVKLAAGWLLEKSGWKGKRFGPVGMHDKQALVMVNYECASGQEVIALAKNIQADVLDKFGIELEIEPVIV
jgi:UDP-N-acetylmuramate dehydrogenase